jgi:predicted DNA-binding transcriptional regulator AlpA
MSQAIPATAPAPQSDDSRAKKRRSRLPHPAPLTLPPEGDGLVREVQACAALQIGRSTLWRWAAERRLQPVRLGRMTRWRISDLRRLLNAK